MNDDRDVIKVGSSKWEVRLVTFLWRFFSGATYVLSIGSLAIIDVAFGAIYYSQWFKFLPAWDLGLFVVSFNLMASIAVSVITSGVQISFWINVHRGKDGIFYSKWSERSSIIEFFANLLPALAILSVMVLDTLADSGGFTRASFGPEAAQSIFPPDAPFGWWVVDLVIVLVLLFDEKIAASLLSRLQDGSVVAKNRDAIDEVVEVIEVIQEVPEKSEVPSKASTVEVLDAKNDPK